MTGQTILEARLRARDDGLVGQLTAAEVRARGVAGALGSMASASRGAAAATGQVAAADKQAAAAARDLAAAQKQVEAASKTAARAEAQAAREVQSALNVRQQGQRQLGFQVQDFFVQVGSGQSVMTAFSQQASQVATVLTLMGGAQEGATGKFAKFANFMAGPWGIALGVAIPLVTLLGAELFRTGDAAKAAEQATDGLASAQSVLGQIFDEVTGKIKSQNEVLLLNARLNQVKQQAIAIEKREEFEQAVLRTAPRGFFGGFGIPEGRQAQGTGPDAQLLRDLQSGKLTPADAVLRTQKIDPATSGLSRQELRNAITAFAESRSAEAGAAVIESSLKKGELDPSLRRDGPSRRRPRGGGNAAALARFGDSAEDRIARIADSYNPAPRGLDKAFADLRSLDRIIEDLGKRKPPSFEKLIGEANAARGAVLAGIAEPIDAIQARLVPLPEGVVKARAAIEELDGVIAVLTERKPPNWEALVAQAQDLKQVAADTANGPLNDMLRASREQREQQLLVLQGREREAEVLARIQQLQRDGNDLTADQRRIVEALVASEEKINELLDKRQDIIGIYLAAVGDLRGALEDLFSGGSAGDFLKSTKQLIKDFQGRTLVESLFGDSLRALEKRARGKSPLDREIEDLAEEIDVLEREAQRGSKALGLHAAALASATAVINRISAGGSIREGVGGFLDSFNGARPGQGDGEIVVSASRPSIGGTLQRDQTQFLRDLAKAQFDPLAELFDKYLGTDFFKKLSPVFQGAYSGFFTAGPVGGVLGAIKELPGLPKEIAGAAGKAFEGAQTGTLVAGITKALGLKTSTTGAQIGGAIGSALPIPGGEIIGSIAGGLIGGALKPAKRGSATITSADGDAVLSGNSSKFKAAAGDAASSVQSVLQQVADQLGGTLGDFAVSIGVRDGKFRVDPTGKGITKTKKGAIDFGEDGDAAVSAAALNAIADGGIEGLSQAVQKALGSNKDIDKALREALKVQEVEELLGGLGGTLEKQFREFEAQAKERVRIATQYGFDVTRIEARNAEDRAKLVEDILSSRVGSLQDLLKDLKFGDLFEGSATDRRDRLLTEIATVRTDAEKGVDGAADKLADLTRQLVETSREAFGTAGGEFASDRAGAISTAEAIIAAENERVRAAQQATIDTSKALQTQNQLTNETNDILAEMRSLMRTGSDLGAVNTVLSKFDTSRTVELR